MIGKTVKKERRVNVTEEVVLAGPQFRLIRPVRLHWKGDR